MKLNKKILLALISLAGALSPAWAVKPEAGGQLQTVPSPAEDAPSPTDEFQLSDAALQQPDQDHAFPQERPSQEGMVQGNKIPPVWTKRDKVYRYTEPLTVKEVREAERMCSGAAEIKGHIKNMHLIDSLARGKKVECITIPLEVDDPGLILLDEIRTEEQEKEVRDTRKRNLKSLKRMKDLAIKHLIVEIDVNEAGAVQRILEWVMKNPYGATESVTIKNKFPGTIAGRSMDLRLPTPLGTKTYCQKKLKSFSLEGLRLVDSINADIVQMIEKNCEVESLTLKGSGWESPLNLEKSLGALAKGHFPNLKAFSVCSNGAALKEIEKALWAPQLTSLDVAAAKRPCGGEAKTLSDASWNAFPRLEVLKLSGFGNEDQSFDAMLKNIPEVKSLRFDNCKIDLSNFSSCLEKLSDHLIDLNLEKVTFLNKDDGFVSMPPKLRQNFQSLALKNCGLSSEEVHLFLGDHESFPIPLAMTSLDVSGNDIYCLGAVYLKEFPYLQELNIAENPIGICEFDSFCEYRRNFPSLKNLTLSRDLFDTPSMFRMDRVRKKVKTEADYLAQFKENFQEATLSYQNDDD